ncbi:hypothetical protein HYX06_00105 [Candidatus Woesearchaeota archaeon]|nr:hypothetical protein [Candidatus Woesearchaeota archaeon]
MMESQLRRTTGTAYGELMRDSGISLPEGRYITGIDFTLGLVNGGVIARRSVRPILKDIWDSPNYGLADDAYTGIQIVRDIRRRGHENTPYIFNPWREIMGGNPFIHCNYYEYSAAERIFGNLSSPRKIAKTLKNIYELFVALPQSLQEDFLHQLNCDPCHLGTAGALDLTSDQLRIYHQIMSDVSADQKEEVRDMLRLMSVHNICVDKGEIVRREIDHLMGFDISTIPTRWRRGNLEEEVLTEERVRELKDLLQRKKIRTS